MTRIVCVFLILFSVTGFSQSVKEMSRTANKHFKKAEYANAKPLYEKLVSLDPSNTTYTYKYGACVVMLNNNNDQALKYLLYAEKNGKSDKEVAFFIGKAYENSGKYEEAVKYYERFLLVADNEEVKKLKVKKSLKSCKKMLD